MIGEIWKKALLSRQLAFGIAWLMAGILVALSGCQVGPDYREPDPPVPDEWHQALVDGLDPGAYDSQRWWDSFDDPILCELIDIAVTRNLDLVNSVAILFQARAAYGVAASDFFPNVDWNSNYRRQRSSANSPAFVGTGVSPGSVNDFTTALDATWEIDLWGQIARSVQSAEASVEASAENVRDVLITVRAEVAASYVTLRTVQTRLRIAETNIVTQRQTLELVEQQFESGITTPLEVNQAKSNLERSLAQLPALRGSRVQQMNRLSVLLGFAPGAVGELVGRPSPIPEADSSVAVGLPADLIRRRPDVRRAERELAAQTALIGVATADLYPKLSLLGSFGFEATRSGDLLQSSSRTYGVGPSVSWNILNGDRIRSQIKVEDMKTEQAYLSYESTVLLALEETENALTGYVESQSQRQSLGRAAVAQRVAVGLARAQYAAGTTDFLTLLDSERTLLELEDEHAVSRGRVSQYLIQLYKALGGELDATGVVVNGLMSGSSEGDKYSTPETAVVEEMIPETDGP